MNHLVFKSVTQNFIRKLHRALCHFHRPLNNGVLVKWIFTAVFYVFQNDGRARGAEPSPQPAITLLASESEEPRLAGGQPRQQTVGERRLSGHRHGTSLNDGQQCAGDIEEDGNVGSGAEREVGTGIGDSPYKQAPVVDVQQVAKYVSSEQHATKLDQSEHGFSNIFDRYAVEKSIANC